MLENIVREVVNINAWLEVDGIGEREITNISKSHSFESKASRKQGNEKRGDLWRRKGVAGDWKNWFDDEMIEEIKSTQEKYQELLLREHGN